ncbi:MAG: hypothetical protein ACPLW9_00695 [Minisyncoccales bacterium]
MVRKAKVAIVSLTSDEGCQFVLLDLGKKLFDFLKQVELVDFALIEDRPFPKGKIDVVFVEGVPINKEEIKFLKEVRKKAKILVALGNCAALGGIPEMKNYQGKEKTIRFIYKKLKNIANPEIKEIDNFVKVDFVIPGCPINGEEFLQYGQQLIKGEIPQIPSKPVCVECSRRGSKDCFLIQKKPCLGLVTLAGCEAVCPNNGLLCLGCRGLLKEANIKNYLALVKSLPQSEELEENLEIFGIKDDIAKYES